jgi:arylsulfatase A-like enzyme
MTQSIDIIPTVLEVLGLERPKMDGRSWMPLIRGENRRIVIHHQQREWRRLRQPISYASGANEKSAFVITPLERWKKPAFWN